MEDAGCLFKAMNYHHHKRAADAYAIDAGLIEPILLSRRAGWRAQCEEW